MPLVFFTFSRVLRRDWRLHSTDTSPLQPGEVADTAIPAAFVSARDGLLLHNLALKGDPLQALLFHGSASDQWHPMLASSFVALVVSALASGRHTFREKKKKRTRGVYRRAPRRHQTTSCYGSSCANNGKGALNTPETLPLFSPPCPVPRWGSRYSPLFGPANITRRFKVRLAVFRRRRAYFSASLVLLGSAGMYNTTSVKRIDWRIDLSSETVRRLTTVFVRLIQRHPCRALPAPAGRGNDALAVTTATLLFVRCNRALQLVCAKRRCCMAAGTGGDDVNVYLRTPQPRAAAGNHPACRSRHRRRRSTPHSGRGEDLQRTD
eukprot:3311837-Pyramimonas_sp.AAC.1